MTHRLKLLVTGAAGGIGLGIKQQFLAQGHVVCSVDPEHQDGIRQVGECEFEAALDVSDGARSYRVADDAARLMGGIDALINNAGVGGARKPVDQFTEEEWRRVFAVNVDGAFFAVRACLPHLKTSGNASIIHIATASVRIGLPRRAPYVASKMALLGLSRSLARELGPQGIRSNVVLPGAIENERGHALMQARATRLGVTYQEAMERRLGFISMRTRIKPDEIGSLCCFLASPFARHITGQEIFIDGNMEWED